LTPGITVLVPHWNRRELLDRLLVRLYHQTAPIRQVLVVDNGSDDGSIELAHSRHACVIALGRNVGFSGAVNRGLRETTTEHVAIVNNDVEPEPDWLERLAAALDSPRVWFAVGKLLDAANTRSLDGTFDELSRGACAWRAGQRRPDGPLWNRGRRIRFASFTAAVFRTELFHRVGLLDETFESYLEDVDFCLRCAVRGYSGLYVPEAVARHIGSATLGRWHPETVRRISRNQVLLIAKHYPGRCLVRWAWAIVVGQLLWGGLALRHRRALPFLSGKVEGARLFLRVRRQARRNAEKIRADRHNEFSRIVEQSESEIYRLQRRTAFDLYWRLYFALTSLQ
jgi:GT2 family glycosyltransferase